MKALWKKAEHCATAEEFIEDQIAWRTAQGVETTSEQIEGYRYAWQDAIDAAKRRRGVYVPTASTKGRHHGRYL